jgi:hypothetical protein
MVILLQLAKGLRELSVWDNTPFREVGRRISAAGGFSKGARFPSRLRVNGKRPLQLLGGGQRGHEQEG